MLKEQLFNEIQSAYQKSKHYEQKATKEYLKKLHRCRLEQEILDNLVGILNEGGYNDGTNQK